MIREEDIKKMAKPWYDVGAMTESQMAPSIQAPRSIAQTSAEPIQQGVPIAPPRELQAPQAQITPPLSERITNTPQLSGVITRDLTGQNFGVNQETGSLSPITASEAADFRKTQMTGANLTRLYNERMADPLQQQAIAEGEERKRIARMQQSEEGLRAQAVSLREQALADKAEAERNLGWVTKTGSPEEIKSAERASLTAAQSASDATQGAIESARAIEEQKNSREELENQRIQKIIEDGNSEGASKFATARAEFEERMRALEGEGVPSEEIKARRKAFLAGEKYDPLIQSAETKTESTKPPKAEPISTPSNMPSPSGFKNKKIKAPNGKVYISDGKKWTET